MTSSSSTPALLHQPPTVAATVKVSSVAILHVLRCCLVHEPSQGNLPDRFCLDILQFSSELVSGRDFIMQANDQECFSVAMVPAHLYVLEYQKEFFKLQKKKKKNISAGGLWDFNRN